jgi:hypothetical protein
MSTHETHEPDLPVNWPDGHVRVANETDRSASHARLRLGDVAVTITDPAADECMMVRLGEYDHYLHTTTTAELAKMVAGHGDRAAVVTVHGVTQILNQRAVRALAQQLQDRVAQWQREALGNPLLDPRA